MQMPLEISYRDVEKTDHIESLVRQKVAKLEQICDYMISCRVAIEQSQQRQQTGNPYRVRIIVRVPPEHEMVVTRVSAKEDREEPLPTVIRKAFEAMRRQLQELVELQRAEVKNHPETEVSALVEKIFPQDDYGFLKTLDGRQVYFHRNSVLHGEFERLEIGTGVRYTEELGEKGPQATTVEIEDKPVL